MNFIYRTHAKSFIILAIFLFSQYAFMQTTFANAIVTGKIENAKSKFAFIIQQKMDTVLIDTAMVNIDNGEFSIQLDVKRPDYYTFRYGREISFMYLSPGDSLHISLNPEEFDESIQYAGKGQLYNNFLAKRYLFQERNFPIAKKLYSLEEDRFVEKTDSLKFIMEEFLSDFVKENKHQKPDKNFIQKEEARIIYTWANQRMNYIFMYPFYAQKEQSLPSEKYNKFLKKLKFNSNELITLMQYKQFLSNYPRYKAELSLIADKEKALKFNAKTIEAFQVVVNEYEEAEIKNFILYNLLAEQINYKGIKNIEPLIETFNSLCENEKYKTDISNLYNIWAPLKEGVKAPEFTFKDLEDNDVSLSDFKGKYVFIDVWATWCKPCLSQIPALSKLEEEFEGKNIVFMSISIDKNKNTWKQMVTKQQLQGVQLHAGPGNPVLKENYLISSIPRFMLIDKDGHIIDVNSPRPSENIGEILKTLDGI